MKYAFLALFLFLNIAFTECQPAVADQLKALVTQYKGDVRGPYRDIRWFCPDGTTLPPKERCSKPGGVQRARYKDEVIDLGKKQHLFLGQILSTTPKDEFWDEPNGHSRLKQYQIEKYLRSVDDGWILRKAQYYRGAIQVEDEEAWGKSFYLWLLESDDAVYENFFLVRQSLKDVPHAGDNNLAQSVRSLSKILAEKDPRFENIRVKIHGQPEPGDIEAVRRFGEQYQSTLSTAIKKDLDQLVSEMTAYFKPVDFADMQAMLADIPKSHPLHGSMAEFLDKYRTSEDHIEQAMATAETLWYLRQQIHSLPGASARLAAFHLSIALERHYLQSIAHWDAPTVGIMMDQICHGGLVAAGTGLLEEWEWQSIAPQVDRGDVSKMTLEKAVFIHDRGRAMIEWATGTIRGVYQPAINQYGAFEELAFGFTDDVVRSSVLLPLGRMVSALGSVITKEGNFKNNIPVVTDASSARGLNAGYAMGTLVVVTGNEDEIEVNRENIYVFQRPPADLKPIAGIATVTEGNMVSHVQLLARNLGIPNAVISNANLTDLLKHTGEQVFYAVSPSGTVILKPSHQMTNIEQALFKVVERKEEKVRVPIEKIDLSSGDVINMRDIDASASGRVCGPKAANLGQLKKLFPDKVVEGIVIPFGVFRAHMDQSMPGTSTSYWNF